jgi:hypothetical protein
MAPLGPFAQLTDETGKLTANQTLALVVETVREAAATTLAAEGERGRIAGIESGTMATFPDGGFALRGYSDARGVVLVGTVSPSHRHPGQWFGELVVAGRRAAAGELIARGGLLTGTLDGHAVSVRVNLA